MEARSDPSPPTAHRADAILAPAYPDATGPAMAARDSGAPKPPPNAAPIAGSVAVSSVNATEQASPAGDRHDARTAVQFPLRAPSSTTAISATPPASPASAGAIGGALFSLILVIALILALAWLARRMPGIARSNQASGLRVVASLSIGQRERLMVVDVGGTQLLIGAGPGGINTLHTLEQPLQETPASSAPSPFAQILSQHFGKKNA